MTARLRSYKPSSACSWSAFPLEIRQLIIEHLLQMWQATTVWGISRHDRNKPPKLMVLASVNYAFGNEDCLGPLLRAEDLLREKWERSIPHRRGRLMVRQPDGRHVRQRDAYRETQATFLAVMNTATLVLQLEMSGWHSMTCG